MCAQRTTILLRDFSVSAEKYFGTFSNPIMSSDSVAASLENGSEVDLAAWREGV